MSTTNRRFPSWTVIAGLVIPLVVGGLFMIVGNGIIVSYGYGLLVIASLILLFKFVTWGPIWTRLAFVKIEVQGSGLMGFFPPLPYNIIYGEMTLLEVKFKLSSILKVHLEYCHLYVGDDVFVSRGFSGDKNGIISGVYFEVPIQWFKGKTRKAYMIMSAKGKEWRPKEFTIKVDE